MHQIMHPSIHIMVAWNAYDLVWWAPYEFRRVLQELCSHRVLVGLTSTGDVTDSENSIHRTQLLAHETEVLQHPVSHRMFEVQIGPTL